MSREKSRDQSCFFLLVFFWTQMPPLLPPHLSHRSVDRSFCWWIRSPQIPSLGHKCVLLAAYTSFLSPQVSGICILFAAPGSPVGRDPVSALPYGGPELPRHCLAHNTFLEHHTVVTALGTMSEQPANQFLDIRQGTRVFSLSCGLEAGSGLALRSDPPHQRPRRSQWTAILSHGSPSPLYWRHIHLLHVQKGEGGHDATSSGDAPSRHLSP